MRSPLSEDTHIRIKYTLNISFCANFFFPKSTYKQLTATEQLEIRAQPGGCVRQSQRHSPRNDFFPWAGHTRTRETQEARFQGIKATHVVIAKLSQCIIRMYLSNGAGVTIWTICGKSKSEIGSVEHDYTKFSTDIIQIREHYSFSVLDLLYHCNGPRAWCATINMSSGMVGRKAPCINI